MERVGNKRYDDVCGALNNALRYARPPHKLGALYTDVITSPLDDSYTVRLRGISASSQKSVNYQFKIDYLTVERNSLLNLSTLLIRELQGAYTQMVYRLLRKENPAQHYYGWNGTVVVDDPDGPEPTENELGEISL